MMPFDRLRDIPGAENAFLVGGSVRDALLGRRPQDYDVAVFPPVRRFAEEIARSIGGHCVDLGKPGYQIIRVVSGKLLVDVSPVNGPTIQADLLRRDFTINALACRLSTLETIDCTGGREDLRRKTIRMVSAQAFMDDPVRLIRAYRLAAGLGFRMDPATSAAIKTHAALICKSAGERIRVELLKVLDAESAFPWIEQMARSTLLFSIIPELEALKHCPQAGYHDFDAWKHTMRVFEHMEAILIQPEELLPAGLPGSSAFLENGTPALLKLAALLHDIGKPPTRREKRPGEIVFHGHQLKGAEMAMDITLRLKFSTRERQVVTGVIRHHLTPLWLFIHHEKSRPPKNRMREEAATRFFMKCGPLSPLILLHALADHRGKTLRAALNEDDHTRFIQKLLAAYVTDFQRNRTLPPLVTGYDLISEFGLRPGPGFKSILNRVEEARLSGEASSRGEGLKIVAAFLAAQGLEDRQDG